MEDIEIEDHFRSMGYTNVTTIPNFKPYVAIDNKEDYVCNRFVFVSRITPLKGCDIILSAVKQLNRKGLSFSVDFFGPIENGYPFEEYIEEIPNVSYKGIMSLKSRNDYEKLSKYSALLFPTFYPNEGFPGTLIDGFIAGVPIITTEWRYNNHIVDNNITGWLLPIQDSEALANTMEKVINNNYDLFSISNRCKTTAIKYDTNTILSKQVLSSYFSIQ